MEIWSGEIMLTEVLKHGEKNKQINARFSL